MKEIIHPNQTTIYDFLPNSEFEQSDIKDVLSNDEKIEEFKKLVIELKNDIEILKANDSFNDDGKVQTVCVLRECINRIENILKG